MSLNIKTMKYILIVLFTIFTITMCNIEPSKTETNHSNFILLPDSITNFNSIGNSWYTFELNGDTFLYHKEWMGRDSYECITKTN